MTNQIEQWHAEHVNFSRLLDILGEEIGKFHEGENPNFDLMLETISYLREQGDGVHHRREDAAFACLVNRDPTMRLQINRLLQEHRVIAMAGDELAALLEEVIGDVVVSRKAVEAAAALYLVYYRHHLATEERNILPRAIRSLTAEDWNTVASSVPP